MSFQNQIILKKRFKILNMNLTCIMKLPNKYIVSLELNKKLSHNKFKFFVR